MKAEERTIIKVLTEQICYEIPPYQRPYSWERDNVEQLLQDIWEACEKSDQEYFIGSLITIEKELDSRYEVVDGQQRLTTLNLILARLRDHIKDEAARAYLGNRILPKNVLTGEAEKPRLTLRAKDQSFFRRHVLDAAPVPQSQIDSLEEPQRHLLENMIATDAFLAGKDEATLKLFADYLLKKVYVVFVNTNSFKSAYRLFNVLNARGLPLSNADLIKNALFAKLSDQSGQSQDLEDRWIELEETVGIGALDTFFGHHRTAITATKAREDLFKEFEPIIKTEAKDPFAFLEGLTISARNYARINQTDFKDPQSLRSMNALHRVGYDEWIPPLLAYLNHPVADLPEPEFLQLLEKITMQNWVRRLGRTKRLTVYFQLISTIKDKKSAETVRAVFLANANNAELRTLLNSDVYGLPYAQALLLRLEEASQDESVTKTYGGLISIEHVLPQALKKSYWTDRFNMAQQNIWLHRLGNLTLLSGTKNSQAQYDAFPDKKKIYEHRNKKVSFDMTKAVCQVDDWTEAVIQERQDRMVEQAWSIWKIE
jgi:hypothetical protein